MAFRLGLSRKLSHLQPLVVCVSEVGPFINFDMCLFLQEEDASWVRRRMRQLRPVFVQNEEQARKVIRELEDSLRGGGSNDNSSSAALR